MDAKIGGHLTPRFDADQKFLTAYTIGKNYSALSPRLAFGDLRAVARELASQLSGQKGAGKPRIIGHFAQQPRQRRP